MNQRTETRRSFMRKGAVLAAGMIGMPAIVPAHVLGRNGATAPSERVVLGHIGAGGRGNALLQYFREMKECQCVAVCDPFADRRDKAAHETNGYYEQEGTCIAYRDFHEMLLRDDIDAVVIATPDHWHVYAALAAVRAGKDIYVEKPLGLCVAEGRALRAEVRRLNRICQYGTQQRSQDCFHRACEAVRNGRIGAIQRVEAWAPESEAGGSTVEAPLPDGFDYDLWLGPAPVKPYTVDRCTPHGAYFISDYAIGFIAGWGSHPLDIAQWGLGTDDTCPVHFEGSGQFPEGGLYDTAIRWDVECTYANGVSMRFMSDNVAQPIVKPYRGECQSHGTTFFGEEGWISVDRRNAYAEHPGLLDAPLKSDETPLFKSGNHARNFVECVKSRQDPVCTIEAAVRSDAISHLSDIAIRLKRPIRWDPETETIADDAEASAMLSRPARGMKLG